MAPIKPRGRPRKKGLRAAWPFPVGAAAVDAGALDFDRIETLVGTLLSREWPGASNLGESASYGEAIVQYIAGLTAGDKDLLLREYLLLEVMLDEVDGPSVADAVDSFLEPTPEEPSV